MNPAMDNIAIEAVTFDSRHAADLAAFWGEVLQRPVDPDANQYMATVGRTGDDPLHPGLMFLQVPEDRAGKNRIHLDLSSHDYRAEIERVIKAGATLVGEFDEYDIVWTSLADPEGNVFDIADAARTEG